MRFPPIRQQQILVQPQREQVIEREVCFNGDFFDFALKSVIL
jgi:hypothetical protein